MRRCWLVLFVLLLHSAVAAAQEAPVVRGRVVADDTGAPIAGARVSIGGLPVHTRSDTDGLFELAVPAPVAPVAVDAPGYARALLPRTATPTDVAVRLAKAAALTVQIINQQGEPVAGTNIRITCGNGSSVGPSNDLGQRRDAHLQPGRCTVNVGNIGAWLRIAGEPTLDQIAKAFAQLQARAPAANADARADAMAVDLRAGEEASIVALDAAAPPQSTLTLVGQANRLPAGSGSVRGRIMGPGRRPIEGARVTLSNADGTLNTLSGPSGDYAFDSVPSGRFKVRAARPGLVGREYGQPSSGTQGRDVDVRDGAQLTGIDIALTRGTAISGVVTGDRGEPLEGVGVQLFRFDDGAGRTRSMSSVLVLTSTDDHGRFRLLPQAAGKYYVGAILVGASHAAGPVYFPDRVDIAGATPIQVEQELDVENVDIRFASTIGTRVSGTAVDADGKPLQEGRVLLSGGDISRNPVLPRTSDIEHGRFEFQNIPPGFYTLSVRPAAETFVSVTVVNGQLRRAPPPPARVGSVSIVVGATPPLPVVIATSFGSTLAGRIELEGAADGVTPASFQLAAYPADNTGGTPGGSIARIGDDWSFQMAGMGQPSWFSFTGPPGWWMKSLTFGGMDAADRVVPFGQPDDSHSDAVAVFSRTAGEITGAVADGAQAVMNYLVVVFPIDPAGWRQESQFVKVGRPNQSGQYSIVVPPGEYLITAVDAAGALGRQMLTTLVPFSEHIVVGGNERVQKNLRLNRP